MKKRRSACRGRRLVLMLLAIVLLLSMMFKLRLEPMVEELACTQVSNEASNLVTDAIIEQIELGNVAYDNIIRFEKAADGSILALKTDMSEINRLKSEILLRISEQIMEFDRSVLGIPLGNLLAPAVLSGHGPMLPVRILAIRNADAEFDSKFTEAGINQTLHQIILNVSMSVTILTPAGTQDICVNSGMVVAETVLIGQVPQTMLHAQIQ